MFRHRDGYAFPFIEGTLAAKMYNYRGDTMELLISLPEGRTYIAGNMAKFTLEDARVKYSTCISKDLVYEKYGEYYIYILHQHDSIFGNMSIAVKTPVHTLTQGERAASVAKKLASDVQVIFKGVTLEDEIRVKSVK